MPIIILGNGYKKLTLYRIVDLEKDVSDICEFKIPNVLSSGFFSAAFVRHWSASYKIYFTPSSTAS